MIRLMATDMDGTLLNGDHEVGAANREAILDAQKQGINIVVATGRSYLEASHPIHEAGIKAPIIAVNGAEIRSDKGEILYQRGIDRHTATTAAEKLAEMGIYFELYTDKGTYTNNQEQGMALLIDIFLTSNPDTPLPHVEAGASERYENGHIKVVNDYDAIFADEDQTVYKFLAFSSNPDKLGAAREVLENMTGLAVSSSGKENLEITSADAQKGLALEWLAETYGIQMQDVMAIGDNYNDLSMMKRAGHAVAMGNAPADIKEQCHHVTATNREDGVAKAMEKLILTPAR